MSKQGWVGVTGAAGGLGREFCRQFHAKGYHVVAMDKSQEGLDKLENVERIALDVTAKGELQTVLGRLQVGHGTPAYWINNAGIVHLEYFHEQGLDDFERVMQVNFSAVIQATHHWLKPMIEADRGIIINIASIAGKISAPSMSSYNASKSALIATSECIQRELAVMKSKVRTVVVNPGFVKTDIVRLGQKDGIPENMQFMLTQPDDCVREIINAVESGNDNIVPTMNGKIMNTLDRLSPSLMSFISVKMAESKRK